MTENPYSVPRSDSPAVLAEKVPAARPLQTIARETFVAWELLRVVYIVVLGVLTIVLTGVGGLLDAKLLFFLIECGIVANIAYFAGPVVETYIRWLGYEQTWPRWVMFALGTLLSMVLAVDALWSFK
ncbi:MAG: hypothetical protein JNK57_12290 [Planctomycetaceae bacterium]|nr:hypothetical protein [Planctomycetaceae bacterium]